RVRTRLLACAGLVALATGALLRITLTLESQSSWTGLPFSLAYGALSDIAVAFVLLAPLALLLWLLPARWLARPAFRHGLLALISVGIAFEAFVEYFFFEEFNARFNNIAVDYVLFPDEVMGNVFESYNVPLWTGLALALGILATLLVAPLHRQLAAQPRPWRERFSAMGQVLGVATLSTVVLVALPRETRANRIESEIAACGPVQLWRAFWTAELDYPLYYRTLPRAEARARAASVLGFPAPAQSELESRPANFRLQREVAAGPGARRMPQVVVVVEESLGSDFVGALGGEKNCTPRLDALVPDGLLLRHLVANGNRTVRGLEGVLCSFVPLPGDSIVKRPKSEGVTTLATVFAHAGYDTAFFYGGFGVFDHMKPFALGAGYVEFVEQSDMPDDAFTTIWGAADESIFDQLVARQLRQREQGRPFFATLLSVSNHKPYRVPEGRVEWPAGKSPNRELAVRYADWSVGHYVELLRQHGLAEDTLVLVVGDHGARVYGKEEIPTHSYRIPALFLGVEPALRGRSLERLCSQIDLAPTLLELAGLRAKVPFLGTSLLGLPDDGGRAFVHHNRDIGILKDDALVVLQLQKGLAFYERSGRAEHDFRRIEPSAASPRLRALADDAAAVFGTAYDLYQDRALGFPEQASRAAIEAVAPR
ncbi:MAG: LTA synthase family protein, partial [Planctomycetota bacterium]